MDVAAVTSATQADARRPVTNAASLNYDSFLRLLVAEMKNQDPTNPMDATEYVAQLSTFAEVEQTIRTNDKLDMLLTSSSLAQADAVIGRTITSADGEVSGTVEEVRLSSSGIVAILESGEEVPVIDGVVIS